MQMPGPKGFRRGALIASPFKVLVMEHQWTPRPKPDRVEWLERRLEFNDYASNRDFLDRLNDFCEKEARFPDISFGRTYVNITLRAELEGSAITEVDHIFAASIDKLV